MNGMMRLAMVIRLAKLFAVGALANMEDVKEFTKMLKETSAVVQKALDEHKTLDQMKQAKILDPWNKLCAPASVPSVLSLFSSSFLSTLQPLAVDLSSYSIFCFPISVTVPMHPKFAPPSAAHSS